MDSKVNQMKTPDDYPLEALPQGYSFSFTLSSKSLNDRNLRDLKRFKQSSNAVIFPPLPPRRKFWAILLNKETTPQRVVSTIVHESLHFVLETLGRGLRREMQEAAERASEWFDHFEEQGTKKRRFPFFCPELGLLAEDAKNPRKLKKGKF